MVGTRIVEPSTTLAVSGSPLKAATVRVVRLLRAAIDQRVSPGWTVTETAAPAGAAASNRPAMAMVTTTGERNWEPPRSRRRVPVIAPRRRSDTGSHGVTGP